MLNTVILVMQGICHFIAKEDWNYFQDNMYQTNQLSYFIDDTIIVVGMGKSIERTYIIDTNYSSGLFRVIP